jgi:hypothetical protein
MRKPTRRGEEPGRKGSRPDVRSALFLMLPTVAMVQNPLLGGIWFGRSPPTTLRRPPRRFHRLWCGPFFLLVCHKSGWLRALWSKAPEARIFHLSFVSRLCPSSFCLSYGVRANVDPLASFCEPSSRAAVSSSTFSGSLGVGVLPLT